MHGNSGLRNYLEGKKGCLTVEVTIMGFDHSLLFIMATTLIDLFLL
jgi:hypothetical protein